jgi:alpha-methylacyl-CoA racemase
VSAAPTLEHVRIIELQGIGPVPHAGAMLAQLGADVTVVNNPSATGSFGDWHRLYGAGKKAVSLDLKQPSDVSSFLALAAESDVVLDGLRPGVVDRLGIGARDCHRMNPELVYTHVTGWGQVGELASQPGHDINYLALSGALWEITPKGSVPQAPLNLLGDFAAGAMNAVVATLAALANGGTLRQDLELTDVGGNPLRDGAHFYGVYECREPGTFVAVGALEDKFYASLLAVLGLHDDDPDRRWDPARWPHLGVQFRDAFRRRSRQEWAEMASAREACITPVLSLKESVDNPHVASRIDSQRSSALPRADRHPFLLEEAV